VGRIERRQELREERRLQCGRHMQQDRLQIAVFLAAAQRVFDSAVIGFEAGKFGFLDVLDAQRTLLQIRTQYIQALYDRYRAVADLGRYVAPDAGADLNNRIAP